uniref:Uncharacterized protein n=1 Tax=Anguilla anguilla TaxID=7936 RepID=A0A0E9QP62_ANGAN
MRILRPGLGTVGLKVRKEQILGWYKDGICAPDPLRLYG